MIELIAALGSLGAVVWLMWKAHKAGADAERVEQDKAEIDTVGKAHNARVDVATGDGLPIDADPFNRDLH